MTYYYHDLYYCKEIKTTSMIYSDVRYSGNRRNHRLTERTTSIPLIVSQVHLQLKYFSECSLLKKNTRTVESEFADFEGIDVGVGCCEMKCDGESRLKNHYPRTLYEILGACR